MHTNISHLIKYPIICLSFGTIFFALMEEHRLRTFGNRVLTKVYQPNNEKVRGKWRKFLNK